MTTDKLLAGILTFEMFVEMNINVYLFYLGIEIIQMMWEQHFPERCVLLNILQGLLWYVIILKLYI